MSAQRNVLRIGIESRLPDGSCVLVAVGGARGVPGLVEQTSREVIVSRQNIGAPGIRIPGRQFFRERQGLLDCVQRFAEISRGLQYGRTSEIVISQLSYQLGVFRMACGQWFQKSDRLPVALECSG